jgi:hypothetical protein
LVAGGLVYVAGSFGRIAGVDRNNLAAIDPVTGQATDWHPDVDGEISAMALKGDTLFVAGAFGAVGGVPRFRLAGVTTNTPPVVTDLDLNSSGRIFALGEVNSKILGGGPLGLVRIQRPALAALDVATGAATSWAPDCDGTVHSLVAVDGRLLVGGAFSRLKNETRHGVGAFDLENGELLAWNPMVGGAAYALAVRDGSVYVGGGFEEIGGQIRPALAALNPRAQTPNALDWTPAPWSDLQPATIRALAASPSALFVGGRFEVAGGEPRSNFAVFDLPTRIDQATMPADGIFRLNLVGPLGRFYVFEASTNLVDWTPILTNRAPFVVEDREALNSSQRFYRAGPAQ